MMALVLNDQALWHRAQSSGERTYSTSGRFEDWKIPGRWIINLRAFNLSAKAGGGFDCGAICFPVSPIPVWIGHYLGAHTVRIDIIAVEALGAILGGISKEDQPYLALVPERVSFEQ